MMQASHIAVGIGTAGIDIVAPEATPLTAPDQALPPIVNEFQTALNLAIFDIATTILPELRELAPEEIITFMREVNPREQYDANAILTIWGQITALAIFTIWARSVGPRFRPDQMSTIT